jgi:cholera toxin transcriptional activator
MCNVKDANAGAPVFRFGTFELDTATGELKKDGRARPRIRDQALQILILLLEKPEALVTREELRERLWPADTFVDFDHGLNTAMNQVRSALGDSAANPRFVQTIPRRGYRLIVPVQVVVQAQVAAEGEKIRGAIADPQTENTARKNRSAILSDPDDLPVLGNQAVRLLFSLIQVMYLSFYVACLARLPEVHAILGDAVRYANALFVIAVVSAAGGIPVRFYLLMAMAFRYPGLRAKFRKLFPFVLVLDEVWAFAPFLLVGQIGIGLALASAAVLLYVPFSQRSLLLMREQGQQ